VITQLTRGTSSIRNPLNLQHLREDLVLLRRGILDRRSFFSGFRKSRATVETIFRDADGKMTAVRRSHIREQSRGAISGSALRCLEMCKQTRPSLQ
jgi:hypothetical protein